MAAQTAKKCRTCLQPGLASAIVDYETTREHDGRSFRLLVPKLEVLQCGLCGSTALSDEADERICAELLRAAGLLSPDEIRRSRESLGLSHDQLGAALGEHSATIARWERGRQIQQFAMDKLLRLVFTVPQVRRELGLLNDSPKNRRGHENGLRVIDLEAARHLDE